MATHIEIPTLIKICDGVRVNVSLSVSHAVERDKEQRELDPKIEALHSNGTLKRPLTIEDYVVTGNADTVSFWFVGGNSLSYRVGFEINQEDFERIQSQLQTIEFRTKDDRKPSPSETDNPA